MHSLNRLDQSLKTLASTNAIHFNLSQTQENSFSAGLPMRLGARGNVKALGEFKEEGAIVSVKMFDYSAYMRLFESKLYSDLTQEEDSPRAAKRS